MISNHLFNRFLSLIAKKGVEFHEARRFLSTSVVSEPKNAEKIAFFLKETGFSDAQLKKLFEDRRLHCANLEKSIKPKISIFQNFGFSNSEIAEIISNAPVILYSSATRRLYPSLSTLVSLVDSHLKVVRILRKARWFLVSDVNKTLFPNIEFLKNRGVSMKRILHLLDYCPTSAFLRPQLLKKHVEKLESLGMNPSSGTFIDGIWAVSTLSDQVWDLKLRCFMDLGFTESEALAAFRKVPLVFRSSIQKIKGNTEVLLATGKYTRSSIMKHPALFRNSLDKRLMPRIQVLQILDHRKLIDKWPNLGVLCFSTDERFDQEYVRPHLNEAGQVLSTIHGIKLFLSVGP